MKSVDRRGEERRGAWLQSLSRNGAPSAIILMAAPLFTSLLCSTKEYSPGALFNKPTATGSSPFYRVNSAAAKEAKAPLLKWRGVFSFLFFSFFC